MSFRHLFVMDPLPDRVDPDHDTTYVLIEAALERSEQVWVCESRRLVIDDGRLCAWARRLSFTEAGEVKYEESRRVELDEEFGLVWLREDPPFDRDYLFTTYLLDSASVKVINEPTGVRNSNEKLFALEFPELTPPTWVGADREEAFEFMMSVGGRAVLKSLSGYGGEEVHLVRANTDRAGELFEDLSNNGNRPVMLQKFYPSVREEGDRRIILLDGEPLGGLTRYPDEGDFRANLHSGGAAGEAYVSERERRICERIKPELVSRGLHLVGLDLVRDRITEINVTSPTCVQEINRAAGVRLEREIVDYARTQLVGEV